MADVFNMTFYLLFLMSFIQVITAEFCTYYYDYYINSDTRYCSNGCCISGNSATYNNVCCPDYATSSSNVGVIVGIVVGVAVLIITVIVVIVIIVCCCCKRQSATQGHVFAAPNTAVVFSNTTQTSNMYPGVGYPPPNAFTPPHGTNNSSSPSGGHFANPPSYDTVTSPGQDSKGFDTHVNMN